MKLCLPLIASLFLAAGCKTDDADSKSGSAAKAEPTAAKGRSGKIELPAQQRPRPSLEGDRPVPAEDLDAQEEARLERREERRKQRMAELDKDGDGQISDAERDAARLVRVAETKRRLDTNGDGKLTVDELKDSRMARRLGDKIDTIDTDKNGEISPEELKASMDEMRANMWGGRGGRFRADGLPGTESPPSPP